MIKLIVLFFILGECDILSSVAFGTDDVNNLDDDNIPPFTTNNPNSDCGVPFVQPDLKQTKIVGGDEATPHSWPWQIQIRLWSGNSYEHVCGGTILTPSTILTAAHCFFNLPNHEPIDKSFYPIVAGEHNIFSPKDSPTQKRTIKELIVFSEYDPEEHNNDIAIIVLSKRLRFNHNISAACLPDDDIGDEVPCFSTGWGEINSTTHETGNLLEQAYLPTLNAKACQVLNGYNSDTMICAGYSDGTIDTCQGDS